MPGIALRMQVQAGADEVHEVPSAMTTLAIRTADLRYPTSGLSLHSTGAIFPTARQPQLCSLNHGVRIR
jgi:hypothetical protein